MNQTRAKRKKNKKREGKGKQYKPRHVRTKRIINVIVNRHLK